MTTIKNENLSNLNGKEFNELLRTTYLKGATAAHDKQKADDERRKTIILNAILDAARAGRTSTVVMLDACLSKSIEKFLKEAHIEWEYSANRLGGALLSSPTEYAFYWENLKDELVFDEED